MRAEHNIDIHGGEHFGGKYNHTISTLSANIWLLFALGHWSLSGIILWVQSKSAFGSKEIYESTVSTFFFQDYFQDSSPCKSVNIYFLPPYFRAGNLGQSDKEPTHFLPRHKRCSHNYWELHWQKQSQKVWALQVCNVIVANKISDCIWINSDIPMFGWDQLFANAN